MKKTFFIYTLNFLVSYIIQSCMTSEWLGVMAIITSTVNTDVYIQIWDNSLIPSITNIFDDKEVIFHDDNASSHQAKMENIFFKKSHNYSIKWPTKYFVSLFDRTFMVDI